MLGDDRRFALLELLAGWLLCGLRDPDRSSELGQIVSCEGRRLDSSTLVRRHHWETLAQPTAMSPDTSAHYETMTVNASWSRDFGPVTILAFGDRSYTLMIGSGRKLPMIEIGWARWRPNFVRFPRLSRP